ncbi:MAG: S-adenosylmethionine:tRNA ribosyltransferase-isomerase [Deltaproteobacteria bacterium]
MVYCLGDYQYKLPKELIAQVPSLNKDECRMMAVNRTKGSIAHEKITSLENHLAAGDVVVLNDTRVVPARLRGRKESGGRVELLVLYPATDQTPYRCLVKSSKLLKRDAILTFANGLRARVCEDLVEGQTRLKFLDDRPLLDILEKEGSVPLPPYIKRNGSPTKVDDSCSYQTVYAKKPGAVAAPTAGLHFTHDLLNPPETATAINQAKAKGKRVMAVGTTAVRALEFSASDGRVVAGRGWCDLLIYPGYRFRVIDRLLTNFHLPGSSLILLVSAWAGRDLLFKAYEEAVRMGYRFYSYGNAMFIE